MYHYLGRGIDRIVGRVSDEMILNQPPPNDVIA